MNEQVLCFDCDIIRDFNGPLVTNPFEVNGFCYNIFRPDGTTLVFCDREAAEKDPSFLQIIPYIVLRHLDEVFVYSRSKSGGENRLHEKWSIGIGGHINNTDGANPSIGAYWNGFYRELEEEVGFSKTRLNWTDISIDALIYDPSNSVGEVHFGVVHVLNLSNELRRLLDTCSELNHGAWESIRLLQADRDREFESWSSLILNSNLLTSR